MSKRKKKEKGGGSKQQQVRLEGGRRMDMAKHAYALFLFTQNQISLCSFQGAQMRGDLGKHEFVVRISSFLIGSGGKGNYKC